MAPITFKPKVRPTHIRAIYTCESFTTPGDIYTVDVQDASRPKCSCPAGRDNFRTCTRQIFCKHVRAVLVYHRYRVQAQAPIRRPAGMAALQEAFA